MAENIKIVYRSKEGNASASIFGEYFKSEGFAVYRGGEQVSPTHTKKEDAVKAMISYININDRGCFVDCPQHDQQGDDNKICLRCEFFNK